VNTVTTASHLRAVLCAGLCFVSMPAAAEGLFGTTAMTFVIGSCSEVVVAGGNAACSTMPLSYTQFKDGRSTFMIASVEDGVVSFSGVDESWSKDRHLLIVDEIGTTLEQKSKTLHGSGSCVANWSTDRAYMNDVTCNAQDDNGKIYQFKFVSDGSPVRAHKF
jgi:hypothetical protein